VAVLDLQTLGLDGLWAARLIRSREEARQTPVLFLLARDSADFPLAEAYGLGAVDHLTRPIIPEVLRRQGCRLRPG